MDSNLNIVANMEGPKETRYIVPSVHPKKVIVICMCPIFLLSFYKNTHTHTKLSPNRHTFQSMKIADIQYVVENAGQGIGCILLPFLKVEQLGVSSSCTKDYHLK